MANARVIPSAIPTVSTPPAKLTAFQEALKNCQFLPDDAYIRQPLVQALFACSPATVWRMVKRGELPAPKKLSKRVTAWNIGKLRAVLAERGL